MPRKQAEGLAMDYQLQPGKLPLGEIAALYRAPGALQISIDPMARAAVDNSAAAVAHAAAGVLNWERSLTYVW